MNKIWIALSFVALITICGACKDETAPTDPVVDPISKFVTITATAGVGGVIEPCGIDSVKANSSAKIIYTIKPDSGFIIYKVKINGEEQITTGKLEFWYLQSNQKVEIEFKSADYLLITNGKWYLQSTYVQFYMYNDTTWIKYNLDPSQIPAYDIYTMDEWTWRVDGNGEKWGILKWSICGKTLNIPSGNTYQIIYLDKEKMVLQMDGGGGYIKNTYSHRMSKSTP